MVNACPTSEWIETYTVTETCTGGPASYTRPHHPPQFTTTVVVCDACQIPTQTIYQTCPDPTGDGEGEGTMVTVTTSSSPGTSVPTDKDPGNDDDGDDDDGPTVPMSGAVVMRGGTVVALTGLVMLLMVSVF
jgi:hypothetical protein